MEADTVPTLMGILAVYCDFVKKGLLKGTNGKMPPQQQRAIDDFTQAHGCRIFWHEEHKVYLWERLRNDP